MPEHTHKKKSSHGFDRVCRPSNTVTVHINMTSPQSPLTFNFLLKFFFFNSATLKIFSWTAFITRPLLIIWKVWHYGGIGRSLDGGCRRLHLCCHGDSHTGCVTKSSPPAEDSKTRSAAVWVGTFQIWDSALRQQADHLSARAPFRYRRQSWVTRIALPPELPLPLQHLACWAWAVGVETRNPRNKPNKKENIVLNADVG